MESNETSSVSVDDAPVAGPGTRRVTVNGVQLAVIEAGVGGAPLMLVHGFTGSKEDFADEVEPLVALGYHVMVPELRGHGFSEAPDSEEAYSLRIFAEDVIALADQLGWEKFDLLGHSMGGMIAQFIVLEAPERVDRLILMDTHHGELGNVDPDLLALGVQLARTDGLKVIQEILQSGVDPLANPAYTRLCEERPGYLEFAESKMLRCSPAMYAAMLHQAALSEDRLDRLASVQSPTLVQVGELDQPFREASKSMAERMPHATLVVHPGAGHSPQFEATAHWRSSLHDFLGPR